MLRRKGDDQTVLQPREHREFNSWADLGIRTSALQASVRDEPMIGDVSLTRPAPARSRQGAGVRYPHTSIVKIGDPYMHDAEQNRTEWADQRDSLSAEVRVHGFRHCFMAQFRAQTHQTVRRFPRGPPATLPPTQPSPGRSAAFSGRLTASSRCGNFPPCIR